jgi:hypothetical protein
MWIIDRLALRVGGDKEEDEADTVGTCSLRPMHVAFPSDSQVELNFLGKDSMRYHNTIDVTRFGEVGLRVLADGLDFKTFETYRAVFSDHFYGTRNVVATLRWIRPVKGLDGTVRGWKMRARLMPVDKFEDAARVLELAKAGALGFSIGFAPTDRGALTPAEQKMYPAARTITRKADVFEVSATPMPCNMSCAGVSVVADEGKAARLQSLVTKGMAWAKPALDYYRPEKRTIYIVD